MRLTVHRNSAWIRNQLDVTFVLSFISPLQVAQHVSGNHVPIFRSWRLRSVIATCWYCAVAAGRMSEPVSSVHVVLRTPQWTHYLLTGSDSLPAATAQYQHVAITLRCRQFLKMGTWLPETCWATCKGEIKDNTKVTFSWFLIHTELRCTVNHTSDLLQFCFEKNCMYLNRRLIYYVLVLWLNALNIFRFIVMYWKIVPSCLLGDGNKNSVALVRTRTIPTERPPPVGEVSANFCG